MSFTINTYELLVENIGEANAYLLCEKLGGVSIDVPKKAHRTYRIKRIIKKALPIIKKDEKARCRIVNRLAKFQEIDKSHIYKIIREVEYE